MAHCTFGAAMPTMATSSFTPFARITVPNAIRMASPWYPLLVEGIDG